MQTQGPILATALFFSSLVAAAGAPPADAKIHLVTACDFQSFGNAAKNDEEQIVRLFKSHLPADRLHIVKLSRNGFNPSSILTAIEDLPIGGNDAIVFYYSGHGGNDREKGHYLLFPHANSDPLLFRSKLRSALQGRQRLTVILTDCCAVSMNIPKTIFPMPTFPEQSDRISRLFEGLFFEERGLIDITSSSPGEASISLSDGSGSIFTISLCRLLNSSHLRNRKLTWFEVFYQCKKKAIENFESVSPNGIEVETFDDDGKQLFDGNSLPIMHHQDAQRAFAFRIPKPQLGLGARPKPEGGLVVTLLVPDLPAARAGINEGDVILAVDGKRIGSESDFDKSVDRANAQTVFRLKRESGNEVDVTVDLQ
jgi:hypothetical protein